MADRPQYGFKRLSGAGVGGKFAAALDKDNFEYHYPRGFDDCFTIEPDLPFQESLRQQVAAGNLPEIPRHQG